MRRAVSGWGNYPVEVCDVYRPENLDELRGLLGSAPQPTLTPRGCGRSYGDAALNVEGAIVQSDRFDRMMGFDADRGILRCQAAITLADIIEFFVPRGFFFPVTPGTKEVSIGGAIASDVHGKNHHRSGSMSAWVTRFTLMSAGADLISCSRDENAEIFWATVGGMGLTGLIIDADIQLRPIETAFMAVDNERIANLDQLLERMAESEDAFDYSVAWVDSMAAGASLGRSVLMRANHANREELPVGERDRPLTFLQKKRPGLPFRLPNFTLSPTALRAANAVFYATHPTRKSIGPCDAFFYPLDSVRNWNRGYGSRGVLQYQCVIPESCARAGTIALLEALTSSGVGSFLTVLKTLGPGNEGLLSFPMRGHTLALDIPNTGPEVIEALRRLDEIVLGFGGRVYLAKDACMTAATFEQMYPRLPDFKRIKRRLDPEGRFSSSQARRLGLVDGAERGGGPR
ncbi:MAG: FAD-linked oxidase [Deltaproteobacteria bacterium]|nr:FAD-linked oxidase [Deltaproteobacteria bacterium]